MLISLDSIFIWFCFVWCSSSASTAIVAIILNGVKKRSVEEFRIVFTSSVVGIIGIGALCFQYVLSYGSWLVLQKAVYMCSKLFLDGKGIFVAMNFFAFMGSNRLESLAILLSCVLRLVCRLLFILYPFSFSSSIVVSIAWVVLSGNWASAFLFLKLAKLLA